MIQFDRRHLATTVCMIAAVVMPILWTGCLDGGASVRRVGALLPLTGPAAMYGDSVRKGAEIARQEKNTELESLDRRYEIVFEDSRGDAAVGEQAYVRLREQGITVILGPVISSVAERIAALSTTDEILLLSPTATSPDLPKGNPYLFRAAPSDVYESVALAVSAHKKGHRNFAIVSDASTYGQGLSEHFESKISELGAKTVMKETFAGPDMDAVALAKKITAKSPDALFVAGYVDEIRQIVAEVNQSEKDLQIFAPSSIATRKGIEQLETEAEGLVFAQPAFDPDSEDSQVRKFVDAYRSRYGETPDVFSALSYDATSMLISTMEVAGAAAPRVQQSLNAIKRFDGVTGETTFNKHGDVRRVIRLYQIRDGHVVSYN